MGAPQGSRIFRSGKTPAAQVVDKDNLDDPKIKALVQPDLKQWLGE